MVPGRNGAASSAYLSRNKKSRRVRSHVPGGAQGFSLFDPLNILVCPCYPLQFGYFLPGGPQKGAKCQCRARELFVCTLYQAELWMQVQADNRKLYQVACR